jgi:hypothetical protein
VDASHGEDGFGGGGGGSATTFTSGGSGGSGTVILRYSFRDSGVRGGVFAEAAATAVLRFEEPELGTDTITGYRIERSTDGVAWTTVSAAPTVSGTVRTLSLSGLPSASARRFRVTALHGDREGSITELAVVGRGGDSVILVGDDVLHTFTTVGSTDLVLGAARELEYLIVAGGGGGGSRHGGGGGAGGLLTSVDVGTLPVAAGSYPVTVGDGGAGASASGSSIAVRGQDSSALGMVAAGGGAGSSASTFNVAQNGGSGGGARGNTDVEGGEALPVGQGNAGGAGDGVTNRPPMMGGGGGGASAAGQPGGSGIGDGGAGRDLSGRFGTHAGAGGVFAGGGGGGNERANTSRFARGGVGGGGRGGLGENNKEPGGEPGIGGSGGGGGAGGHNGGTNYAGKQGGSGVVILRYAMTP